MNLQALSTPVFLAAFFLGALHDRVLAQDDPGGVTDQHAAASRRMVVEYYAPKKAPVDVLSSTMGRIYQAKGPSPTGMLTFFHPFGQTLLIQSGASEIAEALKIVQQTDLAYVGSGEHTAKTDEQYIYKAKYVSLNAVREALRFMDRSYMGQQPGQPPTGLQIGYVEERGVVLVRGTTAEVSKAKAILDELDVAPPNLLLTCYLVQGKAGESNPALPAALVRDLSALVPYQGFELLSSGMLPSNANSELGLDVELDGGRGEFNLIMRPAAYDQEKGLLSLSSIRFQMSLYGDAKAEGRRERNQRSFSTSTSLATDSFTVLGAVGADPVFVVVRMTQLGN